jgi:predicted metal-binding protein
LDLDTVHIGKCTVTGGTECPAITKIAGELSSAGIKVIRGTH